MVPAHVPFHREDRLIRIHRKLKRRLYPWQLDAREYSRRQKHPALFMRMRLGKTPVAIRSIKDYTPRGQDGLRVLIVAPGSALGSWERELKEEGETSYAYLEGTRSARLDVLEQSNRWFLLNRGGWIAVPEVAGVTRCESCGGRGRLSQDGKLEIGVTIKLVMDEFDGEVQGIVTEYNDGFLSVEVEYKCETYQVDELDSKDVTIVKPATNIKRHGGCSACHARGWIPMDNPPVLFDAVVLDESTFIKNPKPRVSKFFLENFRDVPHRWILTGEPMPEGPLDIWNQFAWLDGSAFGHDSYYGWRNTDYTEKSYGWGWLLRPKKQAKLDTMIAARAFVCRHEDAGIVVKRVYERREFDLPPKVQKAYDTAEQEFVLEWEGKEINSTVYTVARWHWLRQLCSGFVDGKLVWDGKIKDVAELITGELKSEFVVMWFAYNQEINAVKKELIKLKVGVESITGKVSKSGQRYLIERFNNGSARVLLVQSMVDRGLQGGKLDSSDTAIYFSNNPSEEIRTQSEDRLVDVRKQTPILYTDMTARGTVESDIVDLLRDKKKRSDGSMARAAMERMRLRVMKKGLK